MSNINSGIKTIRLTDKHLLEEHRTILGVIKSIKSGKAIIKDIPEKYTLGKGHIKFFYNKIQRPSKFLFTW